jgi:hypothetical protein
MCPCLAAVHHCVISQRQLGKERLSHILIERDPRQSSNLSVLQNTTAETAVGQCGRGEK